MASSNSPCAACKFLRRKCTQECVFAPYFPPDQPQKFANVHKVFGASNVAKLLNELNPTQREDAVNSLAYEAEARLRDPIYGCVGHISILQTKLKQIQHELFNARKELCTFVGPAGMIPVAQQHQAVQQAHAQQMMNPFEISGMGLGMPPQSQIMIQQQQQQQQQMYEAQQMAAMVAAREQQELLRNYEHHQQQQQQQELLRFTSGGFDINNGASTSGFNLNNGASTSGFNLNSGASVSGFNLPNDDLTIPMLPSYDNLFQPIHDQNDEHDSRQQEQQLQLHNQEPNPEVQLQSQTQQRAGSADEHAGGIDPTS